MRNSEYWRKRLEDLEKAQVLNEAKYVGILNEEYEKALSSIKKETNSWLTRFAVNNQISLQDAKKWLNANELKELKWDVDEYIKYGQENGIDLIWRKELENASAKVHISRLEALQLQIQNEIEKLSYKEQKSTQDFILDTYNNNYYNTAYELQKGFNAAFSIQALDTNIIKKVISKPWAPDELTFSDRIWKNKKELINSLQTDLTQSLIKGESPDKLIEKISKEFKTSKNKAARLVMTESAFFGSASRKDCFRDLGVTKYEIVATLDSHTSEICRELDGKVYDVKDYQPGITAPPFHIWCRSTTAPYFEDEYEFAERAARNKNGKTYYVPANIKYNEWYEKYVKNGQNIPKMETKDNLTVEFTKEQLEEMAKDTNELVNAYTTNDSKWSGNIQITENTVGKEWDCSISVDKNTTQDMLIHEHLHAHSISYYGRDNFKKYWKIEEASVQLYTQEICKKEKIQFIESQYDEMVTTLRKINKEAKLYENEFDFAKELFETPLLERVDYLEEKLYNKFEEIKSIEKYQEISDLIESLRS